MAERMTTEGPPSAGAATMRPLPPQLRLRWLAWIGVAMLLLVGTGRAWAAMELAYFRGTSTQSSVLLEWATLREFNVAGFEILCKLEIEPDTAYHPIGSRIGQGSPDLGASYSFNVTALTYGTRYCFRLREVTSDNTPGEQFDLCGYGPGVAPPALDVVTDATPTPIILQAQPGVGPAPTLVTPGSTFPGVVQPTPITPFPQDPFTSPLGFPTPTPTLFGQPEQPFSPLPTPLGQLPDAGAANTFLTPVFDPFATPTVDPFAPPTVDPFATPTVDPFAIPTVDPFATPTPTGQAPGSLLGGAPIVDPLALATETPTPTATPTDTPTAAPLQESPLGVMPGASVPGVTDPGVVVPGVQPPGEAAPGAIDPNTGIALVATPTPIYLVVTATPTPDPLLAVAPPVFTPWPTATPPPVFAATNLLAPSSQNLMVMLLCLIFLSASGLGVLGLVTSIIYMRSQSTRDRLPGPIYDRRRYL